MKTRIALTLAVLVGLPFLNRAFFTPVGTIVKNQAAVATVNGGDAAFVAQQAVGAGLSLGSVLLALGGILALVLIWAGPVKKFWNEDPVINSQA